jgi:transposase
MLLIGDNTAYRGVSIMTNKRKPYTYFTKEFKQEAVRLLSVGDRPAAEIAMQLGIRRNQLYKWKEQIESKGEQAFKERGRPLKEEQSAMSLLKQENERLKEEVDILKKAAAYFARELK